MSDRQSNQDVTSLLQKWQAGDAAALEQLLPLVYDELRRVARARLRQEQPGHSLQATALVHEAYLRLMGPGHPSPQNRTHLFAVAARLMRQILVDHARKTLDARLCQVVELKFFAGLNINETAEALKVSTATFERDWTVAKAWLHQRLSSSSSR